MSRRKEFNFARLLPALVPAVLFAFIAATSAHAQPTVVVDTVTLDSDATGVTNDVVNGKAAVCSGNRSAGLDVDATFTSTFTAGGETVGALSACTSTGNCNSFSGDVEASCDSASATRYQTATVTNVVVSDKLVDATASDGTNMVTLGVNTNTAMQDGTMPKSVATEDGLLTTTVSANAKETRTTTTFTRYFWFTGTSCVVAGNPATFDDTPSAPVVTMHTSPTGMNSAMYYLDIEGPNFVGGSGGTEIANPDPSAIDLGDSVDLNVKIAKGSACTYFDLNGYTLPALSTSPQTLLGEQFASTAGCPALNGGVAPDYTNAAALAFPTSCEDDDAGSYELFVGAATKDLCADANGIADFPSPDGLPFTLVGSTDLDGKAKVLAPIGPYNAYAHVKCFNVQAGPTTRKGKKEGIANTNPGTLHIAELVRFNSCGTTDPVGEIKLLLKVPSPWKYLMTGNSPAAHVFVGPCGAGKACSIDLHNPTIDPNWTEITNEAGMEIEVLGTGERLFKITIPASLEILPDQAVYARAHVFYDSPDVPTSLDYLFWTKVILPYVDSDWSSKTLVGNPTCELDNFFCDNGTKNYTCPALVTSASSTKKLKAKKARR